MTWIPVSERLPDVMERWLMRLLADDGATARCELEPPKEEV